MGQPKAEVAPKQAPLYRTIPWLSDHKCGVCKKSSSTRWYALLADASNILCNACHSKETNKRRYPSKACASCNVESSTRWYGGPSAGTKLCQKCHSKQQAPAPPLTCAIVQTPRGLVALAETNADVPNEGSAAVLLTSLEEQQDAAQALGIPPDTLDEDGGAAEREFETEAGKVQGLLESGSALVGGPLMALSAPGGPQGLLESAPSPMGGGPVALLTLGAPEKEAGLVESDAPLRSAQSGEQENEKLALVPVGEAGASPPAVRAAEAGMELVPPGSQTRGAQKRGAGATGQAKRPAQEPAMSPSAKRAKSKGGTRAPGGPQSRREKVETLCSTCGRSESSQWYRGPDGSQCNSCYQKARKRRGTKPTTEPALESTASLVVSKGKGGSGNGGEKGKGGVSAPQKVCGTCGQGESGQWYGGPLGPGSWLCRSCYDRDRRLRGRALAASPDRPSGLPNENESKLPHPRMKNGGTLPTPDSTKTSEKRKLGGGFDSAAKEPPRAEKTAPSAADCSEPGQCAVCGTRETSSWRNGPGGPECRKCHDLRGGGPCHLCATTSTCMWYSGPNWPKTTCSKCYLKKRKAKAGSLFKGAAPAEGKGKLRTGVETQKRGMSKSAKPLKGGRGPGTGVKVRSVNTGDVVKLARAELVSRRVGVWWPMDKVFYSGRVIRYTRWNNKHEILYDDGVEEALDLSKEQWKLMDDVEEGEDEYGDDVNGEETEEENEREESEQHDGKADGEERMERGDNEERNGTKESENQNETLEIEAQKERAEGGQTESERDGAKGRNGPPGLEPGSGNGDLQKESARRSPRKRPGDDVPVGGGGKASRRKLSPQGQARPARRSGGKTKKATGTKKGKVGAGGGQTEGPAAATSEKASEAGETASEAAEKAPAAAENASEPGQIASEPGQKASEPEEKASKPGEKAAETREKASKPVVEQAARASEEGSNEEEKALPGEAGPPAERVSKRAEQASAPLELLSEAAGTVDQAAGAAEEGGGEPEEALSGGGVQVAGLGNGGDADVHEKSGTTPFVAKSGVETILSLPPSTVGAIAAPSLPPLVDTTETPQPGNLSQSPPPEDHQLASLEPLGGSSLIVPFVETTALIEQQIKAAHVETEVGAAETEMEQGPADVASGEEVATDVAEIGAEPARGEAGKGSEQLGAPGGEKGGDGIAEPDGAEGPSEAAVGTGGKEEAGADVAKTAPDVALANKKEALAGPERMGTSGVAAKGIAERNSDGGNKRTGASREEAATRAAESEHDMENAAGEGRLKAGEKLTITGPTVKGTAELGPPNGVDNTSKETAAAGAEGAFLVAAGVGVDFAEAKGGAEAAPGSGGAAVPCAIAVREDVQRQGSRKGVAEGAVSGGTEGRNADRNEAEPESKAEGAGTQRAGEETKEAKDQELKSSEETGRELEGQAEPEPCGGEGNANPEDVPADQERHQETTAGSDQEDAPADGLVGQERRPEADSDDGETKNEMDGGCAGEKTEVLRENAEAEPVDLQNEPSVSEEADFPLEDAPSETEEPDSVKSEKEGPEGFENTPGESSRGPQSVDRIEELGPGRELGEEAQKEQDGVTAAEAVLRSAEGEEKKEPEHEDKNLEPDSGEPEGRRGPHSDKPENEAPPQLGGGPGTWPAGGAGGDTCQEGGGSGGDLIIAPEAEVNDAWEHLPSGSTGAKTRSLSQDYWPGELVNGIPEESAGGLDSWQERALAAEREVERLRKEAQGGDGNSERAWGNRLECCTARLGGGHGAENMELKEKVQMMSEHVEWMREEIARLRGALEAQALCDGCGVCVNPKSREIENNGSQGRGCEPEPVFEATALLGKAAGSSKLPPEASAVVETSRGYYSDVRGADCLQDVLRESRGLTSENGSEAERAGEASEMMRRGAVGASARLAGR